MNRLTYCNDRCRHNEDCEYASGEHDLKCPEKVMHDSLDALNDILLDADGMPIIAIDRLRELVEADRDGRCEVLPCKVGDTVWHFHITIDGQPIVTASVVSKITIGCKETLISTDGACRVFCASSFGKTVFLTREEAVAVHAKHGEGGSK